MQTRIWIAIASLLLSGCMKFDISMFTAASLQDSPPPAPPGVSMVARWEFENDWMDAIGSNHGTPVAPTTPAFTTDAHAGSSAADLSSAHARVDVGTSSALTPSNLTVSFWIKRTAPWSGTQIVLWTKPCDWAHADGYYIGLEGTGKAVTLIVSGGNLIGVDANPDTLFALNTWSHVVITFDSTLHEGHIYVDGVDQPLNTFGTPLVIQPSASSTKFIGSCADGSRITWPLDELTVYNGVL